MENTNWPRHRGTASAALPGSGALPGGWTQTAGGRLVSTNIRLWPSARIFRASTRLRQPCKFLLTQTLPPPAAAAPFLRGASRDELWWHHLQSRRREWAWKLRDALVSEHGGRSAPVLWQLARSRRWQPAHSNDAQAQGRRLASLRKSGSVCKCASAAAVARGIRRSNSDTRIQTPQSTVYDLLCLRKPRASGACQVLVFSGAITLAAKPCKHESSSLRRATLRSRGSLGTRLSRGQLLRLFHRRDS